RALRAGGAESARAHRAPRLIAAIPQDHPWHEPTIAEARAMGKRGGADTPRARPGHVQDFRITAEPHVSGSSTVCSGLSAMNWVTALRQAEMDSGLLKSWTKR